MSVTNFIINHRTDGHADVVLLAPVVDQVFDQGRYHTFEAFAAVVGSDVEIVRYAGHLLGIDQHRLGLGTDDDIGFHPVFVQPFYLRIDRSRTHAARYEQEAFLAQGVEIFVNELRGVPQRTDEIGQRIALLQGAELAGRGSDSLRDDRYRALLGVVIGDGQGYSFAEFVDADDDKLSGFCRSCYAGRMNAHQIDVLREHSFFKDCVHYFFIKGSICFRSLRSAPSVQVGTAPVCRENVGVPAFFRPASCFGRVSSYLTLRQRPSGGCSASDARGRWR